MLPARLKGHCPLVNPAFCRTSRTSPSRLCYVRTKERQSEQGTRADADANATVIQRRLFHVALRSKQEG